MDGKPTILVDFDGVIHSYASGWKGADVIPDPPVEGSFEALSIYLQHFNVAVYSSRTGQEGGRRAMMEWFARHGWPCRLTVDGFNEPEGLLFPEDKPAAILTIDDRAICFTGKWPGVEMLKDFQPWNKKAV